jgi:exopolysaccharide biosynthesis predicted pyruvyltransferase EpsI
MLFPIHGEKLAHHAAVSTTRVHNSYITKILELETIVMRNSLTIQIISYSK